MRSSGCGPPQGSLSYRSSSASGFRFFCGALLPIQPLTARMPTARPPFISWSILHPYLAKAWGRGGEE